MKKIEFINGTTIDGAKTFNDMQNNVEEVFNGEEAMGSIAVDDVKCKQLFDKNNITSGASFSNTGAIESNSYTTNFFIQEKYLAVESSKNYIFSSETSADRLVVCEYDASKTFIKRNLVTSVNQVALTTSSTTKYVRLCGSIAVLDTLIFEKGDTRTSYTPYKEFGHNSQESMGKIVVDDISYSNLFDKKTSTPNVYLNADGTTGPSGVGSASDYISIEGDTKYVINYGYYSEMTSYTKKVVFFDDNKTGINLFDLLDASTEWTVTSPTNAKYMRFQYPTVCANNVQLKKVFNDTTDIITGQECPTNEYIDGNRVYRYRKNLGALPNNTSTSYSTGLSSNYDVINCKLYAVKNKTMLPIPYVFTGMTQVINGYVSGANYIVAAANFDASSYELIVDISYTKPSTATVAITSLEDEISTTSFEE